MNENGLVRYFKRLFGLNQIELQNVVGNKVYRDNLEGPVPCKTVIEIVETFEAFGQQLYNCRVTYEMIFGQNEPIVHTNMVTYTQRELEEVLFECNNKF